MERSFFFQSDDLELESLLCRQCGNRAVVVTHPHPLYGGDMHNPVVEIIARAYQKMGCSTLRFNFRGVGKSRGNYDDGKGEGRDVHAALSHLFNLGFKKIDLAGYSFGAWVNAHLDPEHAVYEQMVMISPPVAFMDFSKVSALPRLSLVTAGGEDDIGPPDMIRQHLPVWNPGARFQIIPGTDHFYSDSLNALETVLFEVLQ